MNGTVELNNHDNLTHNRRLANEKNVLTKIIIVMFADLARFLNNIILGFVLFLRNLSK